MHWVIGAQRFTTYSDSHIINMPRFQRRRVRRHDPAGMVMEAWLRDCGQRKTQARLGLERRGHQGRTNSEELSCFFGSFGTFSQGRQAEFNKRRVYLNMLEYLQLWEVALYSIPLRRSTPYSNGYFYILL